MSPWNPSFGSWLASPPPAVALELTATRVVGVALDQHGGRYVVDAHAVEPLAASVATPSLNSANIHDEAALVTVLRSVLQQLGHRTRRVALVLPDSVAKVSLIRFDKVPAKAQDLEQLMRWQVRKAAPFRIDDAQVAWQPALTLPGGGREYLVTLVRRDIVRSYERACETAGVHAGLVDISSFNQINAVLAGGGVAGDWLLVNVAADYATLALVRDGQIIFYRNRAATGERDLGELVHQTAMYHEDRLGGGGFTRVVLAGASVVGSEEAERFRRTLVERIGGNVELIDFSRAAELRDRISISPELLDVLTPAIGVLLRERGAHRARERAASGVA
jgi:type IV pilus assembly protein PilM